MVAELLKFELEAEFNCSIFIFSSGAEMMPYLIIKPDLLILDYFLDSIFTQTKDRTENGLSILKAVKVVLPKLSVIVFSAQNDMKTAVELLNHGAVDYIDKNLDTFSDDLLLGVEQVFRFIDSQEKVIRQKRVIYSNKKQMKITTFMGVTAIVICAIIDLIL